MVKKYFFFAATLIPIYSQESTKTPLTRFMQQTIRGMVNFNKYLFLTPDTYLILLDSAPFYGIGRIIDSSVQDYFYDKKRHRNIHQLPPVFKYSVDPLLGVSFVTLLGLQFLPVDDHTRLVSNTFLAAFPFLFIYKDLLKLIPIKGSLRPPHEKFCAGKKYYGGFPSGHMFEVTFMTYLFGSELGKKYLIPLTAFAVLVGLQSVSSNRHYCSQVVAGAALGCVFGAACKKVVKASLHEESRYGIMVNKSGITFSYQRSF